MKPDYWSFFLDFLAPGFGDEGVVFGRLAGGSTVGVVAGGCGGCCGCGGGMGWGSGATAGWGGGLCLACPGG